MRKGDAVCVTWELKERVKDVNSLPLNWTNVGKSGGGYRGDNLVFVIFFLKKDNDLEKKKKSEACLYETAI